MAISAQIIKKEQVKNGYDIRVNYTDSVTGKIYTKVFFYKAKTEPSDNELSSKISYLQTSISDLITKETYTKNHVPMTREDIEKILREKELLGANEYIEDLKTKTEIINEGK